MFRVQHETKVSLIIIGLILGLISLAVLIFPGPGPTVNSLPAGLTAQDFDYQAHHCTAFLAAEKIVSVVCW